MNVCIPVEEDQGLESPVCAHFGSAPIFLIVDTDTQTCRAVANANKHHAHGMCQPLASLASENLDAIVVGGIGRGAIGKLKAANIQVFLSQFPTVKETIEALASGGLRPVTPDMACGGHGHGHGHGGGMGGGGGRGSRGQGQGRT